MTGHDHLQWEPLSIDLAVRVRDLDRFLRSPDHRIGCERGSLDGGHFGWCDVTDADIDLLVRVREPDERELRYRVCFTDHTGRPLTIFGYKDIRGRRLRLWYDTTRIFVEVFEGTLHERALRSDASLVGVGVLEIPVLTFLSQLPTIRGTAPRWRPWLGAYLRFVWFFSKNLTLPYWEGFAWRRRRARLQLADDASRQILDLARIPVSRDPDEPVDDGRKKASAGRGSRFSSTTTVVDVDIDDDAPSRRPPPGPRPRS